jgi:hypothetical protein
MIPGMESVGCPGCGASMVRVVDSGVRYSCGSCRGHLVGLAPYEREHPGQGRQIWMAAQSGPVAGTCPFCSRDLVAPALPEPPPGVAVCRLCEQVWVPADAEAWLRGRDVPASPEAATAAAPARSHPDSCPGCGAPWGPDPAGRCRYCKEQLAGSSTATVIIEGAPRRAGALDVLLGVIDRSW